MLNGVLVGVGAVIVVAGSTGLALAPLWLIPRRTGVTRSLVAELGSEASEARRLALAAERAPNSWLAELAAELTITPVAASRVVLVNEALATAEHTISATRRWPLTAGWLLAAGSIMGVLVAWRIGGAAQVWPFALIALVGLSVCAWAKRAAAHLEVSQRQLVDRAVEVLVGAVYDAEIVLPRRRKMGWRRR